MQATTLPPALNLQSWNLDQVLDDLNEFGFALIDDIYSLDYVQTLANECTSHLAEFRAAGIQNGVVSHIRSDHILWIDGQLPIAQQHLQTLEHLSQALNQAFYLGIKEVEAHFACYNAG